MNIQLLLGTLERFEKEVDSSLPTRDLIELFCLQIIPFLREQTLIKSLKEKWRRNYEKLRHQVAILEKAAMQEVTVAVRQIEQTIGNRRGLVKKIARINAILSGNPGKAGFTTWPLYREVFFEIKELLEMLLEKRGGQKICKHYAILGVREKQIVKVNTPPKIKKEPYIVRYTFAPSVEKAGLAVDATNWERLKDPAVVWQYFESALWYWNTEESYFEKDFAILNKNENPFPALRAKKVWLEIYGARLGLVKNFL